MWLTEANLCGSALKVTNICGRSLIRQNVVFSSIPLNRDKEESLEVYGIGAVLLVCAKLPRCEGPGTIPEYRYWYRYWIMDRTIPLLPVHDDHYATT